MGKSQFRKRARQAPRYPTRREVLAIVGAGALAACGPIALQGEPEMPEVVDAGATDSGQPDGGATTSGVPELPDAGESDADVPDTGVPDAGDFISGVAEMPDAGEPDAGEQDAGEPDAGMLAGEPELPDAGD
ncbi:MAG: hypothetical protein ACOX6T_02890 [Myxococcales bacterium]|jgi:hypothetical protein